jgi:glycosyltransferase
VKISVITVCYNSEAGILNAIQTVRNQTYCDVEHIIKDGKSKDRTVDLIREHSNENIKLISEKDSGIYDAINVGLMCATGDVIGLMHSDDEYSDESVLSEIACLFEQGFDVVYGDLNYISNSSDRKVIRRWKSKPFRPGMERQGWMPPHPTVYVRKSVLSRIGKYKTDYRIAADYDFILRLFSLSELKFGYIDRPLVSMRVGGASNRNLKNIIQKSKEDVQIMISHGFGIWGMFRAIAYKNLSKLTQFT